MLNKDHVLIADVKTGQERPWHRYQLMIDMYAVPQAVPEFRETKVAGEIIYPDRTQRVPKGGIDQGFVQDLSALIRGIAAPEPRHRIPSTSECRFGDITAADCQAAWNANTSLRTASPTTADQARVIADLHDADDEIVQFLRRRPDSRENPPPKQKGRPPSAP